VKSNCRADIFSLGGIVLKTSVTSLHSLMLVPVGITVMILHMGLSGLKLMVTYLSTYSKMLKVSIKFLV